eukprot:COSAG01_NODE_16761_length_1207_cov_1.070397_1_plen_236_part_00
MFVQPTGAKLVLTACCCPIVEGTSNCLTVPRSITYDPSQQKLLAEPIAELKQLRSAQPIARHTGLAVQPGAAVQLVGNSSVNDTTTSFDLEMDFILPSASVLSASGKNPGEWMTLALLAENATADAAVLLKFNLSASGAGDTVANMSAEVPHQPKRSALNTTLSFVLPAHRKEMHVRVIVDRAIVEVFAGDGRGVVSLPVLRPGGAGGVFVHAAKAVTVQAAEAWEMGCGWAKYP